MQKSVNASDWRAKLSCECVFGGLERAWAGYYDRASANFANLHESQVGSSELLCGLTAFQEFLYRYKLLSDFIHQRCQDTADHKAIYVRF